MMKKLFIASALVLMIAAAAIASPYKSVGKINFTNKTNSTYVKLQVSYGDKWETIYEKPFAPGATLVITVGEWVSLKGITANGSSNSWAEMNLKPGQSVDLLDNYKYKIK